MGPDPQALRGRVAVVAGATRGAGRGIATALGESGATIIGTGRSTRAPGPRRSDDERPETIEETAESSTGTPTGPGRLKQGQFRHRSVASAHAD